jgi:hypothetical protein
MEDPHLWDVSYGWMKFATDPIFVHIQVETQPTSWSPLAVNQIGDSGTKHRGTTGRKKSKS